jgi:hypothetical protein
MKLTNDEIPGYRIELFDDRSVFVGVLDGYCYIEFLNKGASTRIKLTAEAATALKQLIPESIKPCLRLHLLEDNSWVLVDK